MKMKELTNKTHKIQIQIKMKFKKTEKKFKYFNQGQVFLKTIKRK